MENDDCTGGSMGPPLVYEDTSAGLTSALQLVDRTSAVNFFPNSTGDDPRPCDHHDRGTGGRGRESPLQGVRRICHNLPRARPTVTGTARQYGST